MPASCEQAITLTGDLHARPAGALAVAAATFASAVSLTVVAPRPMTPSTLLASAWLVPSVSDTAEENFAAATASAPAGRACRSPVRVITCS